jgi:ribosomal protein S25
VEVLEMTQSPRDKVLWELYNSRKMKKSNLRQRTGLRLSELDSILEELEKEGRVRIETRNMVLII